MDSDEMEAQDYLNRLLWDMDDDDSVEETAQSCPPIQSLGQDQQ